MVLPKLDSYAVLESGAESFGNATVQSESEVKAKILEDFSDINSYQLDPFTYEDKQTDKDDEKEKSKEPVNIQLPLVNVTELEHLLEKTWEVNGKNKKIKDTLDVTGVFPRWAGFGNLSHESDGNKSLNSMFNLGDSKREIEMGVAHGFPNVSMSHEDMIIPETFAMFFGINDMIK